MGWQEQWEGEGKGLRKCSRDKGTAEPVTQSGRVPASTGQQEDPRAHMLAPRGQAWPGAWLGLQLVGQEP